MHRGNGPAKQRCETTQMKTKANPSSRLRWDGITAKIVVPTILGRKVYVYKRPNSRLWQCSSYFAGKNRRTSTKEDSNGLGRFRPN
jgi:hypothetical protein